MRKLRRNTSDSISVGQPHSVFSARELRWLWSWTDGFEGALPAAELLTYLEVADRPTIHAALSAGEQSAWVARAGQ